MGILFIYNGLKMNFDRTSSEIKEFIRNNKGRCALTFGIAVLIVSIGIIGGRIVKKIIEASGTSKKADEAKNVLNTKSDNTASSVKPIGTNPSLDKRTEDADLKTQAIAFGNRGKPVANLTENFRGDSSFDASHSKPVSPYGNKFKGLENVQQILKDHPLENIIVPLPQGLTHNQVMEILSNEAKEVFAEWEQLADNFDRLGNSTTFLHLKNTKDSLLKIRSTIENVFLKTTSEFPELTRWLKGMEGNYLMVRSSSIEDSNQVVNAGGNLSEAYVYPERNQVLASCGRVIASYFGESSLKNQIQAGINPFRTKLQLSVIMQELIGESFTNKKDIPVSLVFFTSEPNYSDEGFRVSVISATHGHGEGVVNNEKVKTDTIYAVRSHKGQPLEVYQKNAKPKRLAPVSSDKGVNLELIDNPIDCQDKRALSKNMVIRLMELGDLVEREMGCPMDMEIVIKGDIIYVVQMREIKREKPNPTYLSDESIEATGKAPIVNMMYAKVLVAGKSSILKINHKNEVLYCKTLKEAEDKFVARKHKVVIVEKDEPALSHPVVNFSSMSIPCFFAKEDTSFLLKEIGMKKPLVVCPQSGRLCLWDQSQASVEDYIKPGFFSHPAFMEFRVQNRSLVAENGAVDVPKDIVLALRELKTSKTEALALKALKTLQQHPLITDLKVKISTLESPKNSPKIQEQIKTLKKIDKHIQKTLLEIEESYEQKAPRMKKLYHIKRFSTLLEGNQTSTSYSLLDTEAHIASIKRAVEYDNKVLTGAKFGQLLDIDGFIINPKDKPRWENFLLSLEGQSLDTQTVDSFKELMQLLQESSSLSMWINMVFLPKSKEMEAREVLTAIIPEIAEKEGFLRLTQELKELEAVDVSSFTDPQRFLSQWNNLKLIIQKYRSPEILNQLSSSQLNQNLTTGLMRKYTDLIDESIKTIKGSPEYSDKDKLKYMTKILKKNYKVMQSWIRVAEKHRKILITQNVNSDSYFQFLNECWNNFDLTHVRNLKSSVGFSVLAAAIGSQVSYEGHKPKTLEDMFTLIHQNQLFTLSHLNKSLITDHQIKQLDLPSFVGEFPALLEATTKKKVYTSGIEISAAGVTMSYNIPLSNHSLCIDIECSRNQEISMQVKFFGIPRLERWRDISLIAECLNDCGLIKAKKITPFTEQEVQFSWQINQNEIPRLMETLQVMIKIADQIWLKIDGEDLISHLKNFEKIVLKEDGENFAAALFQKRSEGLKTHLNVFMEHYKNSKLVRKLHEHVENTYGKSPYPDILEEELKHLLALKTLNINFLGFNRYLDNKEMSLRAEILLYNLFVNPLLKEKSKMYSKVDLYTKITEKIENLEKDHISEEIVATVEMFIYVRLMDKTSDEPIQDLKLMNGFVEKLSPELALNEKFIKTKQLLEDRYRYQ